MKNYPFEQHDPGDEDFFVRSQQMVDERLTKPGDVIRKPNGMWYKVPSERVAFALQKSHHEIVEKVFFS